MLNWEMKKLKIILLKLACMLGSSESRIKNKVYNFIAHNI